MIINSRGESGFPEVVSQSGNCRCFLPQCFIPSCNRQNKEVSDWSHDQCQETTTGKKGKDNIKPRFIKHLIAFIPWAIMVDDLLHAFFSSCVGDISAKHFSADPALSRIDEENGNRIRKKRSNTCSDFASFENKCCWNGTYQL